MDTIENLTRVAQSMATLDTYFTDYADNAAAAQAAMDEADSASRAIDEAIGSITGTLGTDSVLAGFGEAFRTVRSELVDEYRAAHIAIPTKIAKVLLGRSALAECGVEQEHEDSISDDDEDAYPRAVPRLSVRYGELQWADTTCVQWGEVADDAESLVRALRDARVYLDAHDERMARLALLFDVIAKAAEARFIDGSADPSTGQVLNDSTARLATLEAQVARLADQISKLVGLVNTLSTIDP